LITIAIFEFVLHTVAQWFNSLFLMDWFRNRWGCAIRRKYNTTEPSVGYL